MEKSVAPEDVAIVGRSCRLPGASSVEQLWANLVEGRCSVSRVPDSRWSLERFGHPRPKEPGRSYAWAAGVLDDLWSFDPTTFGISPREAEQMDPHQRLMLELTWEALEDAGLPPSRIAGREVGVFIGASSTEYQNIRNNDPAGGDAYTATGGALSIVANRVSHAFDLRGPSFTVDTACSSSLVALHQALEGLRRGQMEMAVVGGVNLLLGPLGFVMFSQASMLSPTGLCHSFDARADGYVRAEGGVVLLLKPLARAIADGDRLLGRIVASGVNSDGRTNGIALPSRHSQAALLSKMYGEGGVDPAKVAFVEAHGTGTRVGDPIEASTIGDVIGRNRSEPLKIGSIKSNIGHLEPASGLAGILKATLALQHDVLPPSLHFDTPNPDIPFEELGLEVVTQASALPRTSGPRYAGVNSFGFGGTNAHVVVADILPPAGQPRAYAGTSDLLTLSAATRPALQAMAGQYASRLSRADFAEAREVAAAAVHRRELMAERLVVEWANPRELVRKLERAAAGEEAGPGTVWGAITEIDAPVAYVFTGNGGQWPGMGRVPYRSNRRFRETFDEIDALFDAAHGWSLTEALFADDVEQRLRLTHVAQPLTFAIQISTARALAADGLRPTVTLGHSVGEIAAATVSGALSLNDGLRVIHARSEHQELIRDTGRMAVMVGTADAVDALCREVGGVEIAAENSPRTFTVAGDTTSVARLGALARSRRVVFRQIDLDYPFHSGLTDPVRDPLLADLAGLAPAPLQVDMVSTVTGDRIEGSMLDAEYWWRNVREPVRFASAVDRAARLGARVFVEIGPRSLLLSNIGETLDGTSLPYAALGVLERVDLSDERDPIRPAVTRAYVRGASVAAEALFGPAPNRHVDLPGYPWQRRSFAPVETAEAVGPLLDRRWHRLLGGRNTPDGLEWSGVLDTTVLPELADHVVGDGAILPGAAFIEMAVSLARQWFGSDEVAVRDLEIVQALPLEATRSREVRSRFSPQTGMMEILSRPRLSRSGWTAHGRARLIQDGAASLHDLVEGSGELIERDAIYGVAEEVGLRYGPAFRLVDHAERHGRSRMVVHLRPSEPAAGFGVDPARLDACFHGLFALFEHLEAGARGTAYIPVRFGQVRIVRPGVNIASASVDVHQAAETAIVADFTLYDEAGIAIGALHDARFQAVRVQRPNVLGDKALAPLWVAIDRGAAGRAGLEVKVDDVLAAADGATSVEADGADLLLEGWAESVVHAFADRMSRSGELSSAALANLEPDRSRWLHAGLRSLESTGAASETTDGWTLPPADDLPAPDVILRTLAAEHPNRSAELLLASRLTDPRASAADVGLSQSAVDGFDLGGAPVRAAGEYVLDLLERTGMLRPDGRGVRILQVGYGPLSHALTEVAARDDAHLTVLDLDPRRQERAKLALGGARVDVVADGASLAKSGYDLIVSAEGLTAFRRRSPLGALRSCLAAGGLLVAVEPVPSLFRDTTLGAVEGWFDPASPETFPLGPLRSGAEWAAECRAEGFRSPAARPVTTAAGEASLLVASVSPSADAGAIQRRIVTVAADGEADPLCRAVSAALMEAGHHVHPSGEECGKTGDTIVFVAQMGNEAQAGNDGAASDALRSACMALRNCFEHDAAAGSELWLVVQGREPDPNDDPAVAGLVAFARTLANEYGSVAVRRIAAAVDLPVPDLSSILTDLLSAPQAETDVTIGRHAVRALRFVPLDEAPAPESGPGVASLERSVVGGLSGLSWQLAEHRETVPDQGEVKIAVEATGLNFRDVMWAMSLLPDDILEDGFAGPTLGLECAGRVDAVGAGVTRFSPGDRVLAFAPSAFRTSVCVPQGVVAPVPPGWTTEAAASVPVTFLTAYYGLVTLANLRRGEWVLIHGAAGGVGLAAIQIAERIGAHVIATAGSSEKRALLRSLGVEHVLDSRSTTFAGEIRDIRRAGVHVVLNSLFGEAMELSLGTLAPFGRFVELGKRDYVANTRIGLRPFRKNLSYFGVDVDQLLSDRDRAGEVFGELMELFASGDLHPLPYRVFAASETVDAFRLMQQSGHVGKILVRPPVGPVRDARAVPFAFAPDRTHLVTGGFGGFGLEAARWLADRGARHLVLLGRSGPASDEARELVAELEGRGVTVMAARCDVASERDLAATLADIQGAMPPIAGVLHAAMVLEDGLAANLTDEQIERVFAPKIGGAVLLDKLLDGEALDYFVLFSSITTFIGNPGQSAYVAANAFLEGLARRRRRAGKPGLALAWGAIGDVGVLARQKGLAESLSKRVGVKTMPAREALDLMAQALGSDAGPVLAVGSLDWGAARRLPALSSPTFAALTRDGSVVDSADKAVIDLRALIEREPEDKVRKQVLDVIVEEIATVLRVPRQDVSPTKKLAEMGLDSLMAIELATALQDRFALDATPSGSVAALTTVGLADHLVGGVQTTSSDETMRVTQSLNERHAGIQLDQEVLTPVLDAVSERVKAAKGMAR